MKKVITCPYCSSTEIGLVLSSKDYFLTNEDFDVDKCSSCNLHFTNPIPSENNIVNYYQSDNYVSHGNKSRTLINKLYVIIRYFSLRWKIRLIQKVNDNNTGTLLDYGCGTGDFLNICKKNNWLVSGVEPVETARTKAELGTNQAIFKALEEAKDTKYDVISLWHVLEHIPDIRKTLKSLSAMIHEHGHIIIAVPNHESYDATYYKEYWAAYDLPRHLWHFDKKSMSKILADASLEISAIIPMRLDSYYVSLLSAKYKKGSIIGYLTALITGLISNIKATKNNNHSSLIYVVKST